MKYLITGATGLLGNNLARTLVELGHQVRVLIRPPEDRKELRDLDVEIFTGELNDPQSIESALSGMDVVVHAAAMIHFGWTRLDESRNVNVVPTELIANAARAMGVRLIHISSVDALAAGKKDEPATENDVDPAKVACAYVLTKREADQVVLQEVDKGLDAVLIYPGLMFGSFDWKPSSGQMITAIATKWIPLGPRGGISAVDVLDVCRGIVAATTKGQPGERYILCGHNMTYVELWKRMAQLLDRPGPLKRMSPVVAWGAGFFGDLATKFKRKEGEVNSAGIKLSSLYHYYSSDKAKSQLGYSISELEPALQRAIEFFREQSMIK